MGKELISRAYLESRVVMKGDYPYFINPISEGNPSISKELLDEITDNIISICDLDCDIILAPEAMAIQYGTALTLRTGIPLQIIRKRGHGLEDEISFSKSTGYGESRMFLSGIKSGTKVFLIDDVLSTGGTLRSIAASLGQHGITITEIVVILNKSSDKYQLSQELGIPIRSILDVGLEGIKPVIRG